MKNIERGDLVFVRGRNGVGMDMVIVDEISQIQCLCGKSKDVYCGKLQMTSSTTHILAFGEDDVLDVIKGNRVEVCHGK